MQLRDFESSDSGFKRWAITDEKFGFAYGTWVGVKIPNIANDILVRRSLILSIYQQRTIHFRPGTNERQRVAKSLAADQKILKVLVEKYNHIVNQLSQEMKQLLTRVLPAVPDLVDHKNILSTTEHPELKLIQTLASTRSDAQAALRNAKLEPAFVILDKLNRNTEGLQVCITRDINMLAYYHSLISLHGIIITV